MPEPQRVHRWHLSSASQRTSHDHQVLFCFTFHFWFTLISRNDSSLFPEVCTYKLSNLYPIFLHRQKSITQILQLILHLFPACFWEDVVLVVLPLLLCCIGACGDKLWMQRKSCKICCIFHYLHVKGHKSSSVKSAIKKWQVLLSGFFIAYYLQWQQLLLHHCTAYHIICS